jgi:hypothetical protein
MATPDLKVLTEGVSRLGENYSSDPTYQEVVATSIALVAAMADDDDPHLVTLRSFRSQD